MKTNMQNEQAFQSKLPNIKSLSLNDMLALKGGEVSDDKRRQRPGGGTTTTSPT